MFPILPMLMNLVGNQKKDQDAAISNEAAGYRGQPGTAQGSDPMALMGSFMDMMKSDKDKKEPFLKTGDPRYDDTSKELGGGGLSKGTSNLLDDEFGQTAATARAKQRGGMPQMVEPNDIDDEDLLSM